MKDLGFRLAISFSLGLPFICMGVYMNSLDSVYYEGWNELFGLISILIGIIAIIYGIFIVGWTTEKENLQEGDRK